MAEPLKNALNKKFVHQLTSSWSEYISPSSSIEFTEHIFSKNWEDLELKERISKIAEALQFLLPNDFKEAAPKIIQLISHLSDEGLPVSGFEYLFIPEYVEKNGINDVELSLLTLKQITKYTSCEFAIRPFIMKHEKKSMKFMLECSFNEHHNIRRFASEGCRSRLPWGPALVRFKEDASLILPILENLKDDESLFVRKSVANNLNDISKDHPKLALTIAKRWQGTSERTNWIVKHGMRTLLKSGEAKALALFGYGKVENLKIEGFFISTPQVQFGEHVSFQFNIENISLTEQKIRLEFAVYFLKNNSQQAKKVFKISERSLRSGEQIGFTKSHAIRPISTRKYYAGKHALALIVNGIEFEKHDFLLNM